MIDVDEETKGGTTTTATSINTGSINTESIEDPGLRPSQAITIVVIGSRSETVMPFISPREKRKYFWTIGNLPYSSPPEPKLLLIYEATDEQLGFPGDAIASMSPWPELWRLEGFEPRPWRGVFSFTHKHKVLFSKTLSLRTAQLPRLKPHVVIDRHTQELNDE